ncbi:glycosyl hydrolase family 81-domain-containing protein [Geopyxis carbonaria]|nr:glycosyl hydrolase family 81-domain-containing protein [Geopyxis carbonaria]
MRFNSLFQTLAVVLAGTALAAAQDPLALTPAPSDTPAPSAPDTAGPSPSVSAGTSPSQTYPPTQTVPVRTVERGETTSMIPAPPRTTPDPDTLGFVNTRLDRQGNPSVQPFPTGNPKLAGSGLDARIVDAPRRDAAAAPVAPAPIVLAPVAADNAGLAKRQTVANIFTPIETSAPLAIFARRRTHPVPKTGIQDAGALQTNKFYANLFLGDRHAPVYTLPYTLWWSNLPADPWGFSFDHREAPQQQYGPVQANGAVEYYINPIWIRSLSLSAVEFDRTRSTMELKALQGMSVDLMFYADKSVSTARRMDVTLCQGMGFVSAMYYGLTPAFDSSILVRSLTAVPYPAGGVRAVKYRLVLESGAVWLLYAWQGATSQPLDVVVVNNGRLEATRPFSGLVQFAKLSSTVAGDALAEVELDAASGVFCKGVTVAGQVAGATGSYQFNIARQGYSSSEVLMYALPHHVKSFESATAARTKPALRLYSGTKGVMTGVVANQWRLTETQLPTNINWIPVRANGSPGVFPAAALTQLAATARLEIAQDMNALTNLDSLYFSGKALAKFAHVCLAASEVLRDAPLTRTCLAKLKTAYARFTSNTQRFPLVYEASVWRGVVSDAVYQTGDPAADFGSGHYNDHHFHYGYFIHAAAIIAQLDRQHVSASGAWLAQNRAWVNTLVRDVANPSAADPYYPVWRSFDWFHGHSWAKGLFPSLDGKDEESSSEDANFAYAMKMWGRVSGDTAMEGRANLLLAVLRRSIGEYMLLSNGNSNHPAAFAPNRLSGILFENKVHHTTYFGTNTEYIHGVHMLPLTPISTYIRGAVFPRQEWDAYWSGGRTTSIVDGWRGILWANVALFDPRSSYRFFSAATFQDRWLDGGASRTWYLAFSGALGGAAA